MGLFWPPGRKAMNLRKNENIVPDPTTWSKQKCVVKRKNFTTFQAAVKAEKYLSQFNDTEEENEYLELNPPKHTQDLQNKGKINFSHLLTEDTSQRELESTLNTANVFVMESDIISTMPPNISTRPADHFQIHEQFDKINSNLENLKENIQRDICSLHVKFDKLIDLMIKSQIVSAIKKPSHHNMSLEGEIKEMKALALVSDLDNLEKKLCDQEFELVFINVMSEIGGTSGKKDGYKIGYLLLDRLFERHLLTLCSWTGSTKKKEKQIDKVTFSRYYRLIEAMYKIIHLADSRYTVDDNTAFFKRILKNSVSRYKQFEKRQSKPNNNIVEASDSLESNFKNVEQEAATNSDGTVID